MMTNKFIEGDLNKKRSLQNQISRSKRNKKRLHMDQRQWKIFYWQTFEIMKNDLDVSSFWWVQQISMSERFFFLMATSTYTGAAIKYLKYFNLLSFSWCPSKESHKNNG